MSLLEAKSKRQMFVYDLIYPAFLGAMLFETLPLKLGIEYFIGLIIVLYYLLDFWHLYFYLEERFSEKQRSTFRYVAFDFLVSLSLFVAFRYVEENLSITTLAMACVPLWFLIYSSELKYRLKFYRAYAILVIIFAIILAFSIPENIKLISTLIYIIGMSLGYGIFIFTTPKLVKL